MHSPGASCKQQNCEHLVLSIQYLMDPPCPWHGIVGYIGRNQKGNAMKSMTLKKTLPKWIALASLLFSLTGNGAFAQNENPITYEEMEEIVDENLEYLKKINRIIRDYPSFSYEYTFDNSKIEDVTVTGVENDGDRKRLEVVLLDLKSNKNMLKNQENRVGVFYSVDEEATYKDGREALQEQLRSQLKYPEKAEDWGVEGTIFVIFVVDDNGEIPFATTNSNVQTTMERFVKDLEMQAIKAIKATSGDWEPAEVENVDVASRVVVPITFDFKANPFLPALIY